MLYVHKQTHDFNFNNVLKIQNVESWDYSDNNTSFIIKAIFYLTNSEFDNLNKIWNSIDKFGTLKINSTIEYQDINSYDNKTDIKNETNTIEIKGNITNIKYTLLPSTELFFMKGELTFEGLLDQKSYLNFNDIKNNESFINFTEKKTKEISEKIIKEIEKEVIKSFDPDVWESISKNYYENYKKEPIKKSEIKENKEENKPLKRKITFD